MRIRTVAIGWPIGLARIFSMSLPMQSARAMLIAIYKLFSIVSSKLVDGLPNPRIPAVDTALTIPHGTYGEKNEQLSITT